jgi:short-subunit dehydrogenase
MPNAYRVAVVTGASAGVGRATAVEFAKHGMAVGLIARNEERLHAAAKEVEAAGGHPLVLPCDVASSGEVEGAAAHAEKEFGSIDVWVNNAMTTVFAPFHDIEPDEYRRATEVTYLGVVHGTMAALKRMRARDHGTIVQVGSALAYRAIPLQSAYCGAKHAIRGFTDSLRTELLHERSRVWVCMVQLPALNTPQFEWCRNKLQHHPQPVPPIYQPEVAARAIVWASTRRRREVYVGAPTYLAITANKFFASILDRYLAKTGFGSQQMDEPATHGPDDLFTTVDADYGAHGRFDDKAKPRSVVSQAARAASDALLGA